MQLEKNYWIFEQIYIVGHEHQNQVQHISTINLYQTFLSII